MSCIYFVFYFRKSNTLALFAFGVASESDLVTEECPGSGTAMWIVFVSRDATRALSPADDRVFNMS